MFFMAMLAVARAAQRGPQGRAGGGERESHAGCGAGDALRAKLARTSRRGGAAGARAGVKSGLLTGHAKRGRG